MRSARRVDPVELGGGRREVPCFLFDGDEGSVCFWCGHDLRSHEAHVEEVR